MARKYICDECGKEMNGDRAAPMPKSAAVSNTTVDVGPCVRMGIDIYHRPDAEKYYSCASDICWSCLSRLLAMAAEVASAKAGALAAEKD